MLLMFDIPKGNHCQLGKQLFMEEKLIFMLILLNPDTIDTIKYVDHVSVYGFKWILFQINPYGKGVCGCVTSPPHVSWHHRHCSQSHRLLHSHCHFPHQSHHRWLGSNNETFIPKVTWAEDGQCYPIHSQVIVNDQQKI